MVRAYLFCRYLASPIRNCSTNQAAGRAKQSINQNEAPKNSTHVSSFSTRCACLRVSNDDRHRSVMWLDCQIFQNARPVISRAPRDVTNTCFLLKRISCFVFEFSTRTRDSFQYSHELAGVSQFENFGRACNVSQYFSVFVMSTLDIFTRMANLCEITFAPKWMGNFNALCFHKREVYSNESCIRSELGKYSASRARGLLKAKDTSSKGTIQSRVFVAVSVRNSSFGREKIPCFNKQETIESELREKEKACRDSSYLGPQEPALLHTSSLLLHHLFPLWSTLAQSPIPFQYIYPTLETMKSVIALSMVASAAAFAPAAQQSTASSSTQLAETKTDMKAMASKLNPIVPFWDPLGLCDAAFWGFSEEQTIGWLRHAEIKWVMSKDTLRQISDIATFMTENLDVICTRPTFAVI